jgi:hypothetical protein
MKLGITASNIRLHDRYADYREELVAMGFDYSFQRMANRWDKVKLAFETYKRLNGDLLVPNRFVVPTNDSAWPEELWGMKLGAIVNGIRTGTSYRGRRKELVAMGFDYTSQSVEHGWDNVKLALETYKKLHGDLLVPVKFSVPQNDSAWPIEIWGMNLGSIVNGIRRITIHVDHREELLAMGFDYSSQSKYGWDVVKLALEIFKERHGTTKRAPTKFIVPEGDSAWPVEMWGMNLGLITENIRHNRGAYAEHREELEAMGFDFRPRCKPLKWKEVKLVLETYKQLHGDLLVPYAFVVPMNDSVWPEELWGRKLGWTIKGIRSENGYAAHREEIAAMGFDYNPNG